MPKGPSGQKRKADVIGNAVQIMRVAAGQEPETGLEEWEASDAAQIGSNADAGV